VGSPARLAATRARERLERLAGPATQPAPSVSYETAFGWPSIEIARCAERIGADVIVLGRGVDVAQNAAENVTAATLRRSRVPVLVAPERHRVIRHVLACVDDTPHAPAVLEAAQEVAGYFGERRPWLRRLERAVGGGLGGVGVAPCETLVRQGDAASEILSEAATCDTDLVVFGYHRGANYGDAASAGSIPMRLLRRATCSLLAVPI
jgi:nucleotide-binding universal stress UspA family protein